MCQEQDVEVLKKECNDVTKMVPKVVCETRPKQIELKEICVDVDIQLPREECGKESREECRMEPINEIVQRCESTVKEVCNQVTETVCNEKCKLVKGVHKKTVS